MTSPSAFQNFRASLRGPSFAPGEPGYEEARKVWNGTIDRHPAVIARCAGVSDVIHSVNFARENDLLVAVRGGGHNIAGNGVCEDGLMIDLSRMKGLHIDPAQRIARAEPGLTWGEFDHEAQLFGLATTGGQISTTGIAGLTLGGGWGHLARRFGLSSDNLVSVDVVTAQGQFLTASASENADLFWGLRGGGGNFGVVTSFQYRLHPVGRVLGGIVAYPFEKAKAVLKLYREFTMASPDEMASGVVLISLPDGTPVVGVVVCHSGALADGARVVSPLKTVGPRLIDQVGPIPYTAAQQLIDAFYPPGLQNYWKSSFLKTINDEVIDIMMDHCARRPSPICHGLIEHQLGGAVRRINHDATAFGHRDAEYSFMSLGVCTDGADIPKVTQWARSFWQAMQPWSSGGVYVNYLGQESDEGVGRIEAAYGSEKYARLVTLKNKYDPDNLFRLNQNIKPSETASVSRSA